jgi:uncharacterized membrane protein (UPF0127 family)
VLKAQFEFHPGAALVSGVDEGWFVSIASEGKSMPVRIGASIVNRTSGMVIADQVEVATSFWARGKGLIGRRGLPRGYALAIKPCNGIHMFFMAIPLDVVHVDREGRVVRILHSIKPWRPGPVVLKSAWVVELPAGTALATGTVVGDRVELVENEPGGPDSPTSIGNES